MGEREEGRKEEGRKEKAENNANDFHALFPPFLKKAAGTGPTKDGPFLVTYIWREWAL